MIAEPHVIPHAKPVDSAQIRNTVTRQPIRDSDRRLVHLLTAAVIATNAGGNATLRAGLSGAGAIPTFSPAAYLGAFSNTLVLAGVALLITWLILQLTLLSRADLSYVLPVTSASYVVVTLIGAFALGEHVSAAHWCGVLLILAGVIIVGRTRPLTPGSGEL